MTKRPNRSFLPVFIGMSLSAAGLILSIPSLFGPHEPSQVWTTGILAGLFVALAAATLYLRPTRPRPPEADPDE